MSNSYPVVVENRGDGVELRIDELFLVVRDGDPVRGCERLLEQERLVLDLAEAFGVRHQLPTPRPPPRMIAPRGSRPAQ